MENIGRYLIFAGVILIMVGIGVYLAARLALPLGRLPGDVHLTGEGGALYFPVATSIVVSLILTLILNVLIRLFRR